MAERLNFTKQSVEAITPDKSRRTTYHDTKTEGLILRVEPSGKKTYCWLRKGAGKVQFKKIGTFPDLSLEQVRGMAAKHNSGLAEWQANDYKGDNPFVKQSAKTIAALADRYVESQIRPWSTNPARAEREVRGMVNGYLGTWKPRRLSSIKRKEIIEWHGQVGKKHGHVTANRAWQLLRTLYNWAIKKNIWDGANPARVMKDDLFPEQSRHRYIEREEMPKFLGTLRQEVNVDLRDFVIIALFTGARRGDVLGMRWNQLSENVWNVPNRKKPQNPYVATLEEEVLDCLCERKKRVGDSEWVFPSFGKSGHLVSLKRGWQQFLKRTGLKNLHVHDLRRTLGSWQANQGTSLEIIGKSLGHGDSRSTKRYARLQTEAARQSVNQATRAMLAAKEVKP